MFDSLAVAATSVGGVGAWARVENAACARRLSAMADELDRAYAASGSAERDQWCLDNWAAVAAGIGAAQNVSTGVAAHQLLIAVALRTRLPKVAAVFATGVVAYRLVAAVVARTRLILDAEALAKVDAELAAQLEKWGSWSAVKTEEAIDYWVDRFDPGAVRRSELRARGRHVDVAAPNNGTGLTYLEAQLIAADAAALDERLDAMAAAVCDADPRTLDQRRADALAALGHGGDRLVCRCESADCAAAGVSASAVVVHVIAEQRSLDDQTPLRTDGEAEPGPSTEQLREMTLAEALAPRPEDAPGPAVSSPAKVLGGAMMPAPLLRELVATSAVKIVPIVHPGDAPPQRRRIPSAVLAWFIRARDLTCRFPGCDKPAHVCDIDHTIPWPFGPTQASNLKCLCREHHLLKTFWGWRDRQLPDGTVVWTSPRGPTYATDPGSRLLFPSLCRPTAPVTPPRDLPVEEPARTQAMPRRSQTRAENTAKAVAAERARNLEGEATERPGRPASRQDPEYDWNSTVFGPRPATTDDDPPPF